MRAMKTFIRFAVVVIAVLAMTISSAQAAKKFVTIAGGASGGTYIVVATGMAKILSKYIPGMRANAEVTGGGFGNTRLIGTKRADFGLTTPDAAYFAVKGGGRFKPGEKYKLRALMSGHASIQHFVTLRKSGIKSVYDYKGKRISIGQPGSSTAAMGVAMLEVLGISTKQFARTDHLTQTEAVAALKDGTVDGTIQLAGIPGGAVQRHHLDARRQTGPHLHGGHEENQQAASILVAFQHSQGHLRRHEGRRRGDGVGDHHHHPRGHGQQDGLCGDENGPRAHR